ncbi:S41 family peptidase [Lysobacter sp. cf310]|uniref:S41 family peptidase n=1 Tax=Lysobacter sp. cf310 TaxID=1761790 RepID=UPI0011141EF0|nr:S41 family peptidase [Lysobacter sp. cf310]
MRLLLPLLLLAPACPAAASETLSAVIAVTKDEAYRSSRVDWPRVEAEAAAVERAEGEDAAVQFVVRALGDRHTWYESPTASRPPASAATPSAALAASAAPRPIAVALPAAQGVPVLQINAWSGKDTTAAASSVRNALIASLEQSACGLVLDFSSNEGGNMWPMLTGLAPLLTEGKLGAFRDAKGAEVVIEKRDGKIYMDGVENRLNKTLSQTPARLPKFIAFAIGKRSASSGEITPIMFRGQSNVRYFGSASAGYSTANRAVPLPNGGRLVLTTSATLDRNGNEYVREIVPDVQTADPIQAAAAWINAQCRTSASR